MVESSNFELKQRKLLSILASTTTAPTLGAHTRTFHCCSEYKQVIQLPGNGHKGNNQHTNESFVEDTNTDNYPRLSEQCTFCSFKMKTSKQAEEVSIEHERFSHPHRCCAKTMSKHRWKRKWNCCSNVPESPDMPTDVLQTVSASVEQDDHQNNHHSHHHHRHHHHHNHHHESNASHQNGAKITNLPTKLLSNNTIVKPSIETVKAFRPSLATNLKNTNRPRLMRPPLTRFRNMFRIFGRRKQSHSRRNVNNVSDATHKPNGAEASIRSTTTRNVKPNQVEPLSMASTPDEMRIDSNGERKTWIDNENYRNAINTDCCDSELETGVQNCSSSMVPALPPPVRRKIRSPDLEELAESLTFVQQPIHHHRRRRKNVLRASRTLSPIHE